MAIKIGANFAYNGKLPNFERDSFKTKAAMKAFAENNIDEGHLSYCEEDGKVYQYKSTNTVDATTGKWRLFKTDIVVDDTLNGTSKNPIQNKAVFDALKLKADVAALAAYQPKYKADYIAKADFNYSDLSDNVNIIDLNGYAMSVSQSDILNGTTIFNGDINVAADAEIATAKFYNINISSTAPYTFTDVTATNCTIAKAIIKGDSALGYCFIQESTIDNKAIYYSYIVGCTFKQHNNANYFYLNNCISGTVIHKAVINESGDVTEAGFESDIIAPTLPGNAPSCEAVKDALQLKADKTQLNGLATKTELNGKADASALNNYVTTATANTTYAKKSDISNVYKFKGTKTNYSELPTTGVVTGDVWNITNADAKHGIKAGDNVAWNGTAWDNLSGVTDLSAYATTTTTDAISADVKKLMDKAFPFTVKVSLDKTLAKKGTSQPVKVTITPKIGDDNTNVDEIMINDAEYHGATPYVYSATATTTTTYNVRVSKEDRTAQGSATITFVNPSYDGAVAANFTATEANIKALTETLRSGKGGTRTFNLNNQKACIAYPKAFGAATGIKDANGFDYLASYTRRELNVNGELYYVYLMTNATTITGMKQTIS